jgi:hypothetical protein
MKGRFWRPFLWTGGLFGGILMFVESLSGNALLAGLVSGLVQGLLFGALMGGINASARVLEWFEDQAEIEVDEGETVQARGLATLEKKGGVLCLTDQHLRFSSHSLNFGTTDWSVSLSAIEEARPIRTLGGLLPNGVRLDMGPGREKDVKTWEREQWCEAINGRV